MRSSALSTQHLALPLLLLAFWLGLNSLIGDSPTMDEQNHLARGAAYALTADPRLSVEHPPLINGLSGLMMHLAPEVRLPTDQPSWAREPIEIFWYVFADQFLWDYNRHQVSLLIFLGRLPILWLTLLLGTAVYTSAQRLWGGRAGLLALAVLLFDPNIMAHGRLITTDLGGTATAFVATMCLWWQWQRPTNTTGSRDWWRGVLWLAIPLGLAFTSKLLTLLFVFIWSAMAFLNPAGSLSPRRAGFGRLLQLWLAGFCSIAIVWLVFGLEWGPFLFLDERLSWLNTYAGPMPTFWSGIERILLISGGGRATFLLGQFSDNGFWLYFPVAWLVKTPLPTLLAWPLAAILLLRDKEMRGRALFLLAPPLLYFLLSLTSALNIGYRHLLPMLPFVAVLIGGLGGRFVVVPWQRSRGAEGQRSHSALSTQHSALLTFYLLLFTFLLPSLLIHPHYLSFFNQPSGGPRNGYNILVDSNIDWGQDLVRLRDWMAENDVPSVKLAWFGTADPAYYNISYEPLPGLPRHFNLWWELPFDPVRPSPGIYAISASNLWELPLADKHVFPYFRARPPDDRIGYSILIYRVP